MKIFFNMTKYALITDFDGTITTIDIGNYLCVFYGISTIAKIEQAYQSKSDARVWMKQHFGPVKTTPQEFETAVLDKAVVREGFRDLCLYAKQNNIPFEVASGGLNIYINPVLKKFDCTQITVLSAKAEIKPDNIEVSFEDYNGLTMEEFKKSRVMHYKEQGCKVIFFGDGPGDYDAAVCADIIFATSRLENILKQNGIKYYPFKDYTEALKIVRGENVSVSAA